MYHQHPHDKCLGLHGNDTTIEFHECMCNFDYSYVKNRVKALKIKHCLEAAKIYRLSNFYNYLVVGGVLVVVVVLVIAAFCSCKWYLETNEYPCDCCSWFCSCRKKPKTRTEGQHDDTLPEVYEQTANGHSWAPVTLPPSRTALDVPDSPTQRRKGSCMNFCLSDPVQDCCEFLDCDFMWRKRSLHMIPIFGRKKSPPSNFQRQPSRPAPPPPQAVVLPQLKYPEPVIDDYECEPVPEAPPSPEPVRMLNPRSLYVDPLTFLQKPFVKPPPTKQEDRGEPIYTKFKNMLSKVKKSSGSVTVINESGVCTNPSGIGAANRNRITGSLASLHNIDTMDGGSSTSSKRSMSLASLHMLDDHSMSNDPRSRISVVSTATEDIPPSARKDEYIDLEEMSKKLEAKRRFQQMQMAAQVQSVPVSSVAVPRTTYTPNFIPASAFANHTSHQIGYLPAVPAAGGKPAVPARSLASPNSTLGRAKPLVPPRPPIVTDGERSLPRGLAPPSRVVKPQGPPPPPPNARPPMESSL